MEVPSPIVTQGNERITDVDDVTFEIWKEGSEQHQKIEAVHKGNGVYVIENTFA
jgi:hypothetical protein